MDVLLYMWGCLFVTSVINFLPIIIAFAKGNANRYKVLLLVGIPYGLSVICLFIQTSFLSLLVAFLNIVLWIAALIKAIKG